MTRVLLLHSTLADFETQRGVQTLQNRLGPDYAPQSRSIGAGGHFLNTPAAIYRIRNLAPDFDILHAFDLSSLWPAVLSSAKKILFTAPSELTSRQVHWLRAILHYRDFHIITPTATLQRTLVQRGIPVEKTTLIRPAVDSSRIKRQRDESLRTALGISADQTVLLAPGESTRNANHAHAVWATSIVNVVKRNMRLLLWGRGPMARAAHQFAEKLAQPNLVILAEQKLARPIEFEELIPQADAALVSATAPISTLPIAQCMSAALPIVATVTPTVSELLEDRHTALMTQPNIPRLLAQRYLNLIESSQLKWQLTDRGTAEAYDYFSQSRFIKDHQTQYNR